MRFRADARRRRCGAVLVALLAAGWAGAAVAQAVEPVYEDRLIAPDTLGALDREQAFDAADHDASGPRRSLGIEARAQRQSSDLQPTIKSEWLIARATLESDSYGFFTLDAAYNPGATWWGTPPQNGEASPRLSKGSFTLNQRLMPFDGGWLASNGVGLVQTSNLDLVNQQQRFGVGSRLVLGAGSQWTNDALGWVVQGSVGEPVALDPVGQSGFAFLGGQAATLGARWRGGPLAYAAQVSGQGGSISDGSLYFGGGLQPTAASGSSSLGLIQVLRHEAGDGFVQGNLLSTREYIDDNVANADERSWRNGWWIDAGLRDGPVEHRVGMNYLPDAQQWLGTPVASGTTGGYYRWRWLTRQLLVEAQIDQQQVDIGDDRTGSVTQLWGSTRYQLDQRSALGLQVLTNQTYGESAWSLLGYREQQINDSSWRVFAGFAQPAGDRNQTQLGVDGSTQLAGVMLTAAAAVATDGSSNPGTDLSASATSQFDQRTAFTLSARRFTAIGESSAGTSLSGTLNLRVAPRWTLTAALNESRGARVPLPPGPGNAPPPLDPLSTYAPRVSFAWLALRYETQAGSSSVALGGRPGQGGGRVEGTLFLDANGNGRLDPGEPLAPNVTILLNGRFSAQTDAQGRFEFPFVVAGEHQLAVLPDNLPLPWVVDGGGMRRISVSTRGTTNVQLGALQR